MEPGELGASSSTSINMRESANAELYDQTKAIGVGVVGILCVCGGGGLGGITQNKVKSFIKRFEKNAS